MKVTGLDVQGMDMSQIGINMEAFLLEYFTGYTVESGTNGIFQETIRLAYDEVDHLLIQPEGKQLFSGDEWFNGVSGFVELSNISNGETETYTAMLVLDESQSNALFLYASRWSATTQSEVNILIKNFMQGGGA